MRIIVIGGSFGGLTTAFELRKHIDQKKCEIILFSKDPDFVFTPSLPWVVMGYKSMDKISFKLNRVLDNRNIRFIHAAVDRIDPVEQKIFSEDKSYTYDYLVIATGHRSVNEEVPGLGPWDGPGHSIMSPSEAKEARKGLEDFLQELGPVVIGCAPGASCIGPAYEFAFELDHLLRKRKNRHKVPITFVTPEPFLGHFGLGGLGKARQFFEGELEARDITYVTSAAISKVTEKSVRLSDERSFESRFSLIIPALAGVKAVSDSPGLSNSRGFIQVDETFRHTTFPNIYAVGVAVACPPVNETPVPVNFPKTGNMTEQMAIIAARNIVADIRGGKKMSQDIWVECIMDMGDRGVRIKANPARPPRNIAEVNEGKQWLFVKHLFEKYYLWKAKRGITISSSLGW